MKKITRNLISVLFVLGAILFSGNIAEAKQAMSLSMVFTPSSPTVVSASYTNLTDTSVTFEGIVNPNGDSTSAWYETISGGPYQTQNLGAGTSDVNMLSYTLTGLTPNTNYQFRVRASNSGGISNSSWVSFKTNASSSGTAPTIGSVTYTNLTDTSVTFNGSVNPNGSTTNAWYETISGGPYPSTTMNLGAGTSSVQMLSYTLTGLTPNTSYQFRVRCANDNGVEKSSWISFTTTGSSSTNPTVSSISPSSVYLGAGAITLNVYGSNFTSSSVGLFDNSSRSTNFISSSHLAMDLTSSDTDSTGSFSISVKNGSYTSNSETFSVVKKNSGNNGSGSSHTPYVSTSSVSGISGDSAILYGSVNPRGHTTTAWFEYGTYSNLLNSKETAHVDEGSSSSYLNMVQSITGLNPNTTYYFRAVASNGYGTTRGSILHFTTGSTVNGVVTTIQATSVTTTSAKLNSIFVNKNGTSAKGYLQYGETSSMPYLTNTSSLGANPSTVFSSIVLNLKPDTIYYFRAIVIQNGITYTGKTLVFKTSKIIQNYPNTNSKPTIKPKNEKPTSEPVVINNETSSMISITNENKDVSVGEEINYLITFKNDTKENFENAKVVIQLPEIVDFEESNFGKKGDNNSVIFDAGILIPDQVGSMTVKAKVSGSSDQNTLITTAVLSYNTANSDEEKDEIAYVVNNLMGGGTGLTANALFGANYLPTSLMGWLLLILAVLGLIFIIRELYVKFARKSSHYPSYPRYHNDNYPHNNADHINNLPM